MKEQRAVEEFLAKHADGINGVLSCFDRIMFKGYLPICSGESMENFMASKGWLRKDFKRHVSRASDRLKDHARDIAHRAGRQYMPLKRKIRKEERARRIAADEGIEQGLICVMSALEGCQSFQMVPGKGAPRIINAPRKCLCLYFYFMDRELGFMHVRMQTWFPFTVQVCVNGHDALAIKMDRHGVAYRKADNCFTWISDPKRVQRFADNLARRNWPRILSAFARRVNPLMGNLLGKMDYYWVGQQVEYATDVMFEEGASLDTLYEKLLRHATLCFGAEDILTFLGKKGLHGNFQGEVQGRCKKRWPGARVRHRMKENWIKMYNKHRSVLRVETVINHPYEFKAWRRGRRNGHEVMGWFPMAKRVGNLPRYAEVSLAANRRYLDALAVVDDSAPCARQMRKAAKPARVGKRGWRGFNPADEADARLFAAVMRGEHAIRGFRNAEVRQALFGAPRDREERRRLSAKVSRLLKRLHVHGLIAKIPRSRRWRVSKLGNAIMAASISLHFDILPDNIMKQAA